MPVIHENDVVVNQGYEFVAREVRYFNIDGRIVLRYKGICTENPVNNSIRHTGYNGGIYGNAQKKVA